MINKARNHIPHSAKTLSFGGFLLAAMGLYFIFIRPSLLPEDLLYMKTSLPVLNNSAPGITGWLQKVFWVMGSYILTTGILTIFIAFTSFRSRTNGAFYIVLISGFSSIAFMTVVNFVIISDFRWVLFAFNLPWAIALILYRLQK